MTSTPGTEFSFIDVVVAGIFLTNQWVHNPTGASGSSFIKAKLFVPAGAPVQDNWGS